jgi:thimet oligopeptidase
MQIDLTQDCNQPFYNKVVGLNLSQLRSLAKTTLAELKESIKTLESSTATNQAFLEEVQFCDLKQDQIVNAISILEDVHPQKQFRDFASKFNIKVSKISADYNFNQKIYRKYKSIDPGSLDDQALYLYKKVMLHYKNSGIDKPKEVRDKIKKLYNRASQLSSDFHKNISENTPTIKLSPDQLKGCFTEFIKTRTGSDGQVEILLVSDATLHILQNCTVKATRERVREVSLNYAKDYNWDILPEYLNISEEIAQLTGFKNHAQIATIDKMIQNPENAAKFIEDLLGLTKSRVQKELQLIKDYKKEAQDNTPLSYADLDYYGNQVASKLSNLDEEALKEYFPYQHVKTTILNIFEQMFGIKFKPNKTAAVWNSDVEAFNVLEADKLIGYIYLDMHPRKGKYNHACSFGVSSGIKDRIIPQNILICNFNKPGKSNPGLQSLAEVNTFFHEFGHLIHSILGGQNVSWSSFSGTKVQRDFVEAPSQLLEEILMDPQVLKRLSKHVTTGQSLTDDIITNIHQKEALFSSAKLKGMGIARQAALSKVSLLLYTTPKITNAEIAKIERSSAEEALSVYGDYFMAITLAML